MSSKRSVLKKIRAGLMEVPEGWEALVEATRVPSDVGGWEAAIEKTMREAGLTVEAIATTTETPTTTTPAAEDFRSSYPRTSKADTAITTPKKRTRKTPTARKTRKSKKSS